MLEILLPIAVAVSTSLSLMILLLPQRYHAPRDVSSNKHAISAIRSKNEDVTIQVLVLGDIGHSPRMQYHALSIARHGGRVQIIGYLDSSPNPSIVNDSRITLLPLSPPPRLLRSKRLPFLLTGPLKVVWQTVTLFRALSYRTTPARWLLVQNPPSIPTLFIAMIVCMLRNTHLLIDWHNYGWSILATTKGPLHPFVRVSQYYECLMARWAPTASFTVSHAMARQLKREPYNLRSPIFVLHDRPADIFQPMTSEQERYTFLESLPETRDHVAQLKSGSMKLLVSSTSWTPDEDFSLLLNALEAYSTLSRTDTNNKTFPALLLIITGKGPLLPHYLARIADMTQPSTTHPIPRLANVTIQTTWLRIADYARLLAAADCGICLHTSSSGVDLPMKVVDMFGAGLPVLGYAGYESWSELVTEGENGLGFEDASGLCALLVKVFGRADRHGFGGGEGKGAEEVGSELLRKLREGARREGRLRWDEEWDGVAGRVLGLMEDGGNGKEEDSRSKTT